MRIWDQMSLTMWCVSLILKKLKMVNCIFHPHSIVKCLVLCHSEIPAILEIQTLTERIQVPVRKVKDLNTSPLPILLLIATQL